MALAAGSLRHLVKVQQECGYQDPDTGEMVTCWKDVASVYASIVPGSVNQFIAANAEQSEVFGRIVIRYRSDVDATMRVVHRGMAYKILGVMADPVSGLEYLTLPVSAGVRVA